MTSAAFRRDIGLGTASAFLLAVLLQASPVAAIGGYYPVSSIPSDTATLSGPADVVVAMDGVTFVVDSIGGRVLGLTADGSVAAVIDGESVPAQELLRPVAADIGPDARVYVADLDADRVSVFERDGTFVRSWTGAGQVGGKLDGPSGVSVDSGGFVYVSDSYRDRVQVFSSTGVYVRTIGSSGTGNGNLSLPGAVRVSGSELYIADGNNRRIQVFSTAGTALRRWGVTPGDGSNPTTSRYGRLGGIELIGARVFVTCTTWPLGDQVVEECDTSGNVVGAWGGASNLAVPIGLGVTTDGRLAIADAGLDQAVRYDVDAHTFARPWSFAGSSGPSSMAWPGGADVADDGTVYVADTGNARVQLFASDGRFQAEIGTSGPEALVAPEAIGLTDTGEELYIADSGRDAVVVYAPDGLYQRTMGSGILTDPSGLFVATDRSVYVADTGADRIVHLALNGSLRATYGAPGELASPTAVAVDASGTVFVSDTGNNRVVSFASTSSPAAVVISGGFSPGSVLAPRGLAFDEQGKLLVVDSGNHRIQRFSSMGALDGVLGERGAGAGEFSSPRGVGVGTGGTVAVADAGNHRVHVLGFDDVAPDTFVSGVPLGWSSRPVTVTLDANDTESGVEAIYYRLGAGAETTYTGPFVVASQGETTMLTRARDKAGNIGAPASTTTRIDSLPPSGTATWAGAQSVIGTTTLTLQADFLDAVEMRTNVTGSWSATGAYFPTRTFVLPGAGTYRVAAEYLDWLGNARTDASTVTVDFAPPTLSFAGLPASGSTTSAVLVGVNATDNAAGVASVWLSVDGAPEQPYVGAVPVAGEGTHTVIARAVDAVGNASALVSATFSIDLTPPGGALAFEAGTTFVRNQVFVVLPDIIGAAEMRYEPGWAAHEWSTYEPFAELTFPGEGVHALLAEFRDLAGNRLSLRETVTVDWTPPSSVASGLPESGPVEGDAVVSLRATDAISGVTSIAYSLDGQTATPYSVPIRVSTEGTHTLAFSAVDRCGNREATRTLEFVVGHSLPVEMALSKGAPSVATMLLSIDSSSTTAVEMQVDAGFGYGPWQAFAELLPLAVSGEGTHTVGVRYRSALGIVTVREDSVLVDLTPPRAERLAVEPLAMRESPDGWKTDLVIDWLAKDGASGLGPQRWRFGSVRGVAQTESATLEGVAQAAAFVLDVCDQAGNRTRLRRGIALGAAPAPWVGPAATSSRPRIVGRLPASGRAHYVVHVFELGGDGDWVHRYQVPARALVLGGRAFVTARPEVAAGTWRFVVEAVGESSSAYSAPSAPHDVM